MNLANIFKATERIEAALAAKTKAETDLATANARIGELEANDSAAENSARIAELEGQVTAITAEREAEKARGDKAESDFAAYQADEPNRINAAAAIVIGSAGFQGPIATVSAKKEDGKPDLSGLTGFSKVAAAFAAPAKS